MMQPIEQIIKQSISDDPELRRKAAMALAGCRSRSDAKCREALLRLICDTDWRVRKATVESVIRFADTLLIEGLVGILDSHDNAGARNSSIEALTRMGSRATQALIEAFGTEDKNRRKFIIDILGEVGDMACLPLMLKALDDPDENVQASAVEHLGLMGDVSVMGRLVEILESGNLWLAFPAAEAIGRVGDLSAVGHLVAALEEKNLREPVLRALGRIGDRSAVSAIIPHVASNLKTVRTEALMALIAIHRKDSEVNNQTAGGVSEAGIAGILRSGFGDSALELLLGIARGVQEDLKGPAVVLLGLLEDDRAIGPLLTLAGEDGLEEEVQGALTNIGRSKPESLVDFFSASNSSRRSTLCREGGMIRRTLCLVAGMIGDPIFSPCLTEALKDSDGHVRSYAAESLSMVGEVSALPDIERLMEDDYQDVQEAAVSAMARLKNGVSISSAIKCLSDRNPVVRRNYAALLGLLQSAESLEALTFALKDENASVRMAVVDALAQIGGDLACKALLGALTDEVPEIRRSAALALGSAGRKDMLGPILLLTRDQDYWVRAAAVESLGNFPGSGSQEALIDLLDDSCGLVRVTAIETLGRVGGTLSVPGLMLTLKDDDPEIRRSSVITFAMIMPGADVEKTVLPLISDQNWSVRKAVADALAGVGSDAALNALKERLSVEEDSTVAEAIREYVDVRA